MHNFQLLTRCAPGKVMLKMAQVRVSTPRKLTLTMHHKKETFYQMHLENGSFQGADQEKNHQK